MSHAARLTAVNEVTVPITDPRCSFGARWAVNSVSRMREHWVAKQFTKSIDRKTSQIGVVAHDKPMKARDKARTIVTATSNIAAETERRILGTRMEAIAAEIVPDNAKETC